MADEPTEEDRSFHANTPQANRAAHAGQGVGARELAAMRDAGESSEDADLSAETNDESDDVEGSPKQSPAV